MNPTTIYTALALGPLLATPALSQSADAASRIPLDYGPHGVGFRVIQAYDSSRAFRPKRDYRGRLETERIARPVQISLWYPAATGADSPRMSAGEFRVLRESEIDFHQVSAGRGRAPARLLHRDRGPLRYAGRSGAGALGRPDAGGA